MAYIVTSDIEDVFGQSNVTKWSDLDNAGVRDTARIATAIGHAEAHFNNRFRDSRFAVPFAGTIPQDMKTAIARIAGVWLYSSRGVDDIDNADQDPILQHRREANRWIAQVLSGSVEPDLPYGTTGPHSPTVVG